MMAKFEEEALIMRVAIEELAENKEALDNFEFYLSQHFDTWLKHFATSPMNLAEEMANFAKKY